MTSLYDMLKERYTEEERSLILRKKNHKKDNAKKRGIFYQLPSEAWVLMGDKLLGRGVCDYTGLEFTEVSNHPMYPSVERIDPKRGYIEGNVCVVGHRINLLKDAAFDKNKKISPKYGKLEDLELFLAYRKNIENNPNLFQELKKKYTIDEYNRQQREKNQMDRIEDNQSKIELVTSLQVEIEIPAYKEDNSLPLDVEIAAGYASLSRAYQKTGKKVSLTFAQYKAIFNAKRCIFTGALLEEHYPVILDPKDDLHAKNVKMSCQKVGEAVANFVSTTGCSVQELAKNLKRLVK